MTQDQKRIAMAVDRATNLLGLAQMVELSGVARRTCQNHCEGICAPSVPTLLAYVRACEEAEHREAADDLLDGILGLVGRQARPLPVSCPDVAPALAVMHASAETGDVTRWAEEALRDGEIDHVEASQGERECREARNALDRVEAMVRGAAARTPQRAFAGVAL